jgi:hypothetical protein
MAVYSKNLIVILTNICVVVGNYIKKKPRCLTSKWLIRANLFLYSKRSSCKTVRFCLLYKDRKVVAAAKFSKAKVQDCNRVG